MEFEEGVTVGQALAAVEEDAGVPRGRQCIVVTGVSGRRLVCACEMTERPQMY